MTIAKKFNRRGVRIKVGQCYHVTWSQHKEHVFILQTIDWNARRAFLRPPLKKKADAFWTDVDQLYATRRNESTNLAPR